MKIARNFTHSLLLALNVFSKIRWAASRSPTRNGRGGTGQGQIFAGQGKKKRSADGEKQRTKKKILQKLYVFKNMYLITKSYVSFPLLVLCDL